MSIAVSIRCDNGSELTSRHFLAWSVEWKIELRAINHFSNLDGLDWSFSPAWGET
jgi:hypothetical protein